MKYLFLFLIAIMPLGLSAEKKVSKIYNAGTGGIQFLTYDDTGRLASWKEVGDDNTTVFDLTIEYISKDKVVVSGIFYDGNGVMEVSLNENGLATSAYTHIDNGDDSEISLSYQNGLMSKITVCDYYNGLKDYEEVTDFEINDGNPVRLISDVWDNGYPTITYSDMPNKCGLVYLPLITHNTAWRYRVLAYAGLQGYGSVNLPYSCNFYPDKVNDYVIDYVIDDEGYVISLSLDVRYAGDVDGQFIFEYCDVNGVDDAETAAVEVIGGKNSIVVNGEYDSVKVYNLNGMSCNATTDLIPGIYIVDVDNSKFKVRVY